MKAGGRGEHEAAEPREAWTHFLIGFEFEAKPAALLIGARWLGEFAYVAKAGLYPGSRVGWRLPESLFLRGGLVELAFRDLGASSVDLRPWEEMGWSWSAVFNATTRDGKPYLEAVS